MDTQQITATSPQGWLPNPSLCYDFTLLALCVWREAQNQPMLAKQAVAWSIRNRVMKPRWWGRDWSSVILMPFQYSSFNRNDPNSTKWPHPNDMNWIDCQIAANQVYTWAGVTQPTTPDPTDGADSYFDTSLDSHPPTWSTDGSAVHTCDIGAFHFYRTL